ncbi:MAG: hypothetical protein ACTSQJ_05485 [Promethearchaeota archaeon]
MKNSLKKKTVLAIWGLICISNVLIFMIIIAFMGYSPLIWVIIAFITLAGMILTILPSYFFEPKKKCPRCNTPVVSMYTEKCSNCGLKLVIKCPAPGCGKYLSTYIGGKPIKYCNSCGLKIKDLLKIEDIIVHKEYLLISSKTRFCPNCGTNIEEEDAQNFCPLCGEKID